LLKLRNSIPDRKFSRHYDPKYCVQPPSIPGLLCHNQCEQFYLGCDGNIQTDSELSASFFWLEVGFNCIRNTVNVMSEKKRFIRFFYHRSWIIVLKLNQSFIQKSIFQSMISIRTAMLTAKRNLKLII
jgi:hypothetical protein